MEEQRGCPRQAWRRHSLRVLAETRGKIDSGKMVVSMVVVVVVVGVGVIHHDVLGFPM
jgi:hypothetical protein